MYIISGVVFGVVFRCLQEIFKVLYTPGVYPFASFVLAIVILIVFGWKQAGIFTVVQFFGYGIIFMAIEKKRLG